MENKIQLIIDYINKNINTIDNFEPNAFCQGFAIGTLETIKADLETLIEKEKFLKSDLKKISRVCYTNVKFEGIDHKDYPDYCDAYIIYAESNGVPLTDDEIEELNDNSFLKYSLLTDYLH